MKQYFETVMSAIEVIGAVVEHALVKIVNSLPEIKFL